MIVPLTAKETKSLLGKDFANIFQREMDLIIDPLRKYIAKGYPLALGKEQWEYVVTESIPDATWCGAGKSLIDVRIGTNKGIDVKGIGRGKNAKSTAEASMYQCFDQNAKIFFKNKDAKSLWDLYVNGWFTKANTFDEYYLIAIIREKETLDCSLCCFKVTSQPVYADNQIIFKKCSAEITEMADPAFIKLRYYNSKSRLEILFQKKCWDDPEYCFPIYKFTRTENERC